MGTVAPRVRQTRLDKLHINKANPRRISDERLASLKRALEADPEMLQARPLIALPDGRVIAGNMRLRAALELGWKTIPAITVDLDETRAQQWLLRDNQEYGEWEDASLAMLLEDLQAQGADLDLTGFASEEVTRLLDLLVEAPPNADDVPDLPTTPITRPGELIELGQHRLYCGDATMPTPYDHLLGTDMADCVWTDPPYNVAYAGGTADELTMQNDDMDTDAYTAFLTAALHYAGRQTHPGAPIYVAHSDLHRACVSQALADTGWTHRQTLIWVKNAFVLTRQDYQWQHESILYGWREGAAHRWYGAFDKTTVIESDPKQMTKSELVALIETLQSEIQTTVLRADKPARSLSHPTMKPVGLVMQMLQNSSRRGDIILDPFGGSGSTLIAADILDRRAYLIELDPAYCDVIRTRYENHAS